MDKFGYLNIYPNLNSELVGFASIRFRLFNRLTHEVVDEEKREEIERDATEFEEDEEEIPIDDIEENEEEGLLGAFIPHVLPDPDPDEDIVPQ